MIRPVDALGTMDPSQVASRYSTSSWKKGTKLIEDEAVTQDSGIPNVFWVEPPQYSDGTKYRVQVIPSDAPGDGAPWVSCTCQNGQHVGGQPRCYHTASVLQLLLEAQANPE